MGNATGWIAQSLYPLEQALWVAAKSSDLATLREGLVRLTPETRYYSEWRDPTYGYTPLAIACSQGHLPCVQALLAYGVDCNARDLKGSTPLHIAASCGKSEVVRLLLETSAVDYFAKTSSKAETALDIARQAYKEAEGRAATYIKCIELIEKVFAIRESCWSQELIIMECSTLTETLSLFELVVRKVGQFLINCIWHAMVLRTAAPDVVEIDLFPMKPGERRPPIPSSELLYKTSHGIQQSEECTWLKRKEYRLSIKMSNKRGPSRASALPMEFATANHADLVAWKTFLTTLRVNPPENLIAIAFARAQNERIQSPQLAPRDSSSAESISITEAAMRQEQRDLDEALRLSIDEARRQPSMPSAPPPSDTMLETLGYSETLIGSDGVEIVQLLRDDDVANFSSCADLFRSSAVRMSNTQRLDECVVCFDGPQEAVCVPCGHNAVCMNCAQELADTSRLCPVCRQNVREVVRLYRV
ncbi:hypothetical protein CCR75_000698 [Bremia lactucae]|uniref:RING-type domain-containing protein n=1 Tax=Bremia lactucae TaxID=4779 RepID=A0A976FF97_BRELC|nr:hypothetical protein CCR75_000698 [Bremia lactucae]